MKKLLSFITLLLAAMTASQAQSVENSLKVFFPQNGTTIQRSYMNNAEQLDKIGGVLADSSSEDWNHYRLVVTSSSSPEGSEAVNHVMSERRSRAMADYLTTHAQIDPEHITIHNQGVDWMELRRLLKESVLGIEAVPYLQYLDSVISCKGNGQTIGDDEILRGFQQVYHGWKYPYIRRYIFPKLRYTTVTLEPIEGREVVPMQRPGDEAVTLPPVSVQQDALPEPPMIQDTTAQPERPAEPAQSVLPDKSAERRPFYLAAKTNLLFDVVLLPNIALEWAFAKHWSVSADWEYAWWSNRDKHRYWRIYGGDVELRYWFGGPDVKPLTGHHVGAYAGIVTYDIEFGGTGYLGDKWSYLFGLSYGYSMPIARRLNLDFELGIGYMGGEYYEYEPIGKQYMWKQTKQRKWFGPTRAEVTLVWLLGRGNTNK